MYMYIVHVNYFKETYSILGGSIRMIMSNFGSSHVIFFDLMNSTVAQGPVVQGPVLWLKGFVAQGPVAQGHVAQGPVAWLKGLWLKGL